MPTTKLDASQWKDYFDDFSMRLPARLAEIEVASLGIGDQALTDWILLKSISYDPKNEVLSIRTEPIEHLIHQPKDIHVEEGPEGIESIGVTDNKGDKQLIRFKSALKLPPRA